MCHLCVITLTRTGGGKRNVSGGDIYQPEGLPDVVFERELEFFQLVDTSLPAHCDSPDLEMTHSQIMRYLLSI